LKGKQLTEVKVLTSQVKKGDKFSIGNYDTCAESDAYINPQNGIWSVDMYPDLIYGWQSKDIEIIVERYV
tara:strand:+ start:47 stop:256 length:210 start_codon:yes stop_codon:yes gene_type:complete